jgi:alpha-beta hydrolase superfamily lysophospholipase
MKRRPSSPYGKIKTYSSDSPHPGAGRVLVVPGYSETIAHNKKLVDALARSGFDASTFSQPRRASKVRDPIQRQGNVVLGLLETGSATQGKIHAIAHSLGSAAVLKAAQEAPERFASITLFQPVGLVGGQNVAELSLRATKKVANNQAGALRNQDPSRQDERGYAANVDSESAGQFSGRVVIAQLAGGAILAKQPALAGREARASGRYEIADDIAKITALGIPVNIVTAYNDEMFDHEKVDVGHEQIANSVTSFSTVADQAARHDTFWMQPERTAKIVEQLISQS